MADISANFSISPTQRPTVQRPSLQRPSLQTRLASAVASGAVRPEDQTALESAIKSIGSNIATDRANGGKPNGDPRAKIDNLISKQVDAGTLTADQASELKSLFANGPAPKKPEEMKNDGRGPEGFGGPPPNRPPPNGPSTGGPPPTGGKDADGDSDGSMSATETESAKSAALDSFLKQLRESLTNPTYSGQAQSGTIAKSNNMGLVVNFTA